MAGRGGGAEGAGSRQGTPVKANARRPPPVARDGRHIALAVARFNPALKAKYRQRIAQGKPAAIAITAVMRKLIVIANTLLKASRLWVKSRAWPCRIV